MRSYFKPIIVAVTLVFMNHWMLSSCMQNAAGTGMFGVCKPASEVSMKDRVHLFLTDPACFWARSK